MKKEQIVKCIDNDGGDSPYLTVGKNYTVVSGEGDNCMFDVSIVGDTAFEIKDDDGTLTFCNYPKCGHATWELVCE